MLTTDVLMLAKLVNLTNWYFNSYYDDFQDYQVWWEFSQKTGYCITSKIRLCQVMSRRYRTMWHLHYTDWGDQGCPNSVSHFLGFLEEMQSVYQHSMSEIPPGHNKNPPILVHCTAGVGRTGLTILSDLLLYTVDHNQVSNFFNVIITTQSNIDGEYKIYEFDEMLIAKKLQ